MPTPLDELAHLVGACLRERYRARQSSDACFRWERYAARVDDDSGFASLMLHHREDVDGSEDDSERYVCSVELPWSLGVEMLARCFCETVDTHVQRRAAREAAQDAEATVCDRVRQCVYAMTGEQWRDGDEDGFEQERVVGAVPTSGAGPRHAWARLSVFPGGGGSEIIDVQLNVLVSITTEADVERLRPLLDATTRVLER